MAATALSQRKSALLLAVQGAGRAAGRNQDAQAEGLSRRIRLVAPDEIEPDPEQPRRVFDEDALARLSETVRRFGILSPIVVSHEDGGRARIVLGERRYRAALAAGLREIPTIATGALSPRERLELQLLENIGREDLNVIEEGRAYARLLDLGASQREVALRVGRSEASVSRALAIATRLEPAWLKEAEEKKELQSPSKLYEISQASEATRAELWEQFRRGSTRAAIEAARPRARRSADRKLDQEVASLLEKLRVRAKREVDGRRISRAALADFALRRIIESWDEKTAQAFLVSLSA